MAAERSSGSRRVVGVIDAWRTRSRQFVPGDLDRAGVSDVGRDDVVTVDTHPHLIINQCVRDRVSDTAQ